jgi:heat-inducible transcriptional repressor
MLSPRTETILKSIVGQYIVKATPVASQSIVNDHELKASPATIRHEMVRLEQEGYITREHPSAGSVPSDKGYRYYVESLGDIELPLAEQRLISHLFYQVEQELDEWSKLTAKIIAQLVQNMAVVTLPKPPHCQFKHLELVTIKDSLALALVVLRGARVKQQLITFDQTVSQSKLTEIADKLNSAYRGLTRSQILGKEMELSATEQKITDCLAKIMETEDEQEYEEPYLNGVHFILSQPEFAASQRAHALLEMIDQGSLLKSIEPERTTSLEVRVVIGGENKAEAIKEYSVVVGQYGLPDEAVGTVGVIGPTRMPYGRTISTVSHLSAVLSRLVTELYGRENRAV